MRINDAKIAVATCDIMIISYPLHEFRLSSIFVLQTNINIQISEEIRSKTCIIN